MAAEESQVLDLLESSGALKDGHFLLSSGLHSGRYVQCAKVLELPERAREVGRWIASALRDLAPDSVLAPAMGGLLVGHETAEALNVPFRFTERKDGEMTLRRGFELRPGERVVIIEDVVTTGKSTMETVAIAEAAGAIVVGVGSIIDRTAGNHSFAMPFRALVPLTFPTFDPNACPLCEQGGQPEKPGSRSVPT